MRKIAVFILTLLLAGGMTTSTCGAATLKAPTGVKAQGKSVSSIKVTWKKVTGAKGYVVYRYSAAKKAYKKVKTIKKGGTTSWKNTSLRADTRYKYKIKAYKISGGKKKYSKFSKMAAAKTFPFNEEPSGFKYKYGVFIGLDKVSQLKKVKDYQIVVIDADIFSKSTIQSLIADGHTVYSYLNVGSIEDFRSYYNQFKDLALGPYDNWPEEQWIDVSAPQWQEFIVNRAKDFKEMGVSGLYVDNCDVYYEYPSTARYNGLVKIMKDLKALDIKPFINGGDTFVEKYLAANKEVDSIMGGAVQEEVYTLINFDKGTMGPQKPAETQYYLAYLNKLDKENIDIVLLEYTKSATLAEKVRTECKKRGWDYYISKSIELN